MKWVYKILPWCFAALFAAEIIAVLMPKRDAGFQIRDLGRTCTLHDDSSPSRSTGVPVCQESDGERPLRRCTRVAPGMSAAPRNGCR